MDFLKRYKAGQMKPVYDEIAALRVMAFDKPYFDDVMAVLNESCRRAALNIDMLYGELVERDYNFCLKERYAFNFQKPIVKPLPDTAKLLKELETIVSPYGYIPESLKVFYSHVGGCNFAWDYDTDGKIPWEGADPIQIAPLDDLLSELVNNFDEEEPLEDLQLSADYLHKDNISGGLPYALEITNEPSFDALLLNEEHTTTFIDYLRISFGHCGFSKGANIKDRNYVDFVKKVKPKLLPI